MEFFKSFELYAGYYRRNEVKNKINCNTILSFNSGATEF